MSKNTELERQDANEALELLAGRTPLPEVSAEDMSEAIMARILSSDSLEDIFREDGSTATRDLVGVPLEVRDCVVRESSLEGKQGVYMLLDAYRLDEGVPVLVNTGSPKVMAQVMRCKQRGFLPIQVQVVEVAAAKPGQSAPLGLKAIGQTAERIAA